MQPLRPGLLLLAAGASSRLGQPKQLLPYQGKTLLRHAAEVAAASGCGPLVLVTGAWHEELLAEVAGLPFAATRNEHWEDGMGSSIRAGLAALEGARGRAGQPAVVVMLCDQPLLTPAVLQALVRQFQATGQAVVASAYGGTRGVPALFSRALFAELRELAGPTGARELLRRHAQLPAVDFPGGEVDVDTWAQYEALAARHS
jgi:molybdenum cofactor cytidylyltransferase